MATICASCNKKIDDLVDELGLDYGDICDECENMPAVLAHECSHCGMAFIGPAFLEMWNDRRCKRCHDAEKLKEH